MLGQNKGNPTKKIIQTGAYCLVSGVCLYFANEMSSTVKDILVQNNMTIKDVFFNPEAPITAPMLKGAGSFCAGIIPTIRSGISLVDIARGEFRTRQMETYWDDSIDWALKD